MQIEYYDKTVAGLGRRFGAMFYDALLIFAVCMVITGVLLTFTGGEAILRSRVGVLEYLFQAMLIAVFVAFFGLFWTRRGQTLGMAAWKIYVEREDGLRLTWVDTIKRLAGAFISLAVFGLGYFWMYVDPDRRTWHDRWTRTAVVRYVPKK
jgi:uncharacterized RDD family membrane protein YckC